MADYRPLEIDKPDQAPRGRPYIHRTPFAIVYFGPNAVEQIDDIVAQRGAKRPAVICTPNRSADGEAIRERLSQNAVLMADAVMHTPADVTDRAVGKAEREGVDLVISIGGGSSVGLGKALTNHLGLRHVAVPTTYAGSEMTPILGETRDGNKRTVRHDRLRPIAVIYDPLLNIALPPQISAASGMNGTAHAIGALMTSDDADIRWAAKEAVRCFVTSLPAIVDNPANEASRSLALYGAWLGGYCAAEASMTLHHKLCHVLGGAYDMPHAQTHAALLPHSFAFNASACPYAVEQLSEVFGGDAAAGLFDLIETLGLSVRLSDLGLPEDGIPELAKRACANSYKNPRSFNEQDIVELLARAWRGERPHIGAF